jgi:hypothetical protein
MLIHDGEQRYLGDPEEAALRYYRLNFAATAPDGDGAGAHGAVPDVNVKLLDAWLEDETGTRVQNVEQGKPFTLGILVEGRHDLTEPVFNFHCLNEHGAWVFAFSETVRDAGGAPAKVAAGERIRITARVDNPLVPGRYSIECWISRQREGGELALHVLTLLDFIVFGTKPGAGSVSVHTDVVVTVER